MGGKQAGGGVCRKGRGRGKGYDKDTLCKYMK